MAIQFKEQTPESNHNLLIIHTDKQIIYGQNQYYTHSYHQIDNQPTLVKELFEINGVEEILLCQHKIHIIKGELFDIQDILKIAKDILTNHLDSESL